VERTIITIGIFLLADVEEGGEVADAASGEMEIDTTATTMIEAALIIAMVRLNIDNIKNIDLNIIIMLLLLQGETRR
jgi:hypothetical protein